MTKLWKQIADFTREIKVLAVEKKDIDSAIILSQDLTKFLRTHNSQIPKGERRMKHEIIKQWKFMNSGDCYLYKIKCSCGEEFGDWTPQDVEDKYKNHLDALSVRGEKDE